VVVIGSGLAGLTAAHALKRRGIDVLILEKDEDVGGSWERRHPQLTLNTHRSLSSLPGLPYSPGTGAFPKRDAVVAHLREFRDRHRFDIRYGTKALAIGKGESHFRIDTNYGIFHTRNLILATGRDALPAIPPWPGLDSFTGRVVHAADFGEARGYAGKSILVVGGGNSGFDVLNHLSRVKTGPVWLSLRRGPSLLPKRLGGIAVHRLSPLMARLPTRLVDRLIGWTQRVAFGDLSRHGFPKSFSDAASRLRSSRIAIAVDDGAIAAVKRGQVSVVPEVVAFSGSAVILEGQTVQPDIVIAAVGYAPGNVDLLAPLGLLDASGQPIMLDDHGATAVPGLWLVGMRPSLTSYFLQAQQEAKSIAKVVSMTPRA
jgi:cation diffusion facilitator CzcD-associated flavoprotein CzcO